MSSLTSERDQAHAPTSASSTSEANTGCLLFTAFEPSGDAHAAPVIAALKTLDPTIPIYAWGGPRMADAGATIVERTGDNAVMGAGSLGKIREHIEINKRIDAWMRSNNVAVHIPVDSPAANFPICKISRKIGCRIVHLVAPQLWAWGPWRVRKLRRLTDLVLCLLPFEEAYFNARQVPARFIGHPVLHESIPASDVEHPPLPETDVRLAVLPGSRPAEIDHNLPTMCHAVESLSQKHNSMSAVIVAAGERIAQRINDSGVPIPSVAQVESNRLHDALSWANVALVCSGTATLDVTRHHVPMVVMYRMNPWPWRLAGRWVVTSPHLALPNLVAGRRVVPEFIPHLGASDQPIIDALDGLIMDESARREQSDALAAIADRFEGHDPAVLAASEIARVRSEAISPT